MTVAELGRRMSSAEFAEWGVFLELEDEDLKRRAREGQHQPDQELG